MRQARGGRAESGSWPAANYEGFGYKVQLYKEFVDGTLKIFGGQKPHQKIKALRGEVRASVNKRTNSWIGLNKKREEVEVIRHKEAAQ